MTSTPIRSANFTGKEEMLFISIVKKYKDILECKLSNSNVNQKKTGCWLQIEKEFNAVNDKYRAEKILRKKYDNIKKRTKKKFPEEKCNVRGTGGGPPINIKLDPIDTETKDILGVRLEGNVTEFGGDANVTGIVHENEYLGDEVVDIIDMNEELIITTNDQDLCEILQPSTSESEHDYYQSKISESTIDIPFNDENQDGNKENMQTGDWSKYTPDMLRSAKSKALISGSNKRKNHLTTGEISNKVSQWAQAKSKLENSKIIFTEKEQLLKLKFLQEKHDIEMSLLQKAADAEEKRRDEEHKLKLKIQQEAHDLRLQILQLERMKLLQIVKK